MGDYGDPTHRTRAQSLGAHVGRPGDLVRKASLNSMFDHYQAGLSDFEGGLSLAGCHDGMAGMEARFSPQYMP